MMSWSINRIILVLIIINPPHRPLLPLNAASRTFLYPSKDFTPFRPPLSPPVDATLPAIASTRPKKVAQQSAIKPPSKEAVTKGPPKPNSWTIKRWQEDYQGRKLSTAEWKVEQEKKTAASLQQKTSMLAAPLTPSFFTKNPSATPGCLTP